MQSHCLIPLRAIAWLADKPAEFIGLKVCRCGVVMVVVFVEIGGWRIDHHPIGKPCITLPVRHKFRSGVEIKEQETAEKAMYGRLVVTQLLNISF